MFSRGELDHLVRLYDRLETEDVKAAFFMLTTLLFSSGCALRPASQGSFSVLQVHLKARNVCAFKGAKSWIRFYFRKPYFDETDQTIEQMSKVFPSGEIVQDGEFAVNIFDEQRAKKVIEYVLV